MPTRILLISWLIAHHYKRFPSFLMRSVTFFTLNNDIRFYLSLSIWNFIILYDNFKKLTPWLRLKNSGMMIREDHIWFMRRIHIWRNIVRIRLELTHWNCPSSVFTIIESLITSHWMPRSIILSYTITWVVPCIVRYSYLRAIFSILSNKIYLE